MKQIILITDGCSNVGVSPVAAAANAYAEGIVVNVVGVIDGGELGELGASEISEIASAGGGMSRIVPSWELSQTVQILTRKTVSQTIEQEVKKQLLQIFGSNSIEDLPQEQRSQVEQVMDDLGETADLKVVLLIDASASMKPKLFAAEEAIRDLLASLQSRQGTSEIAVFHFPGKGDQEIQLDLGWTKDLLKVKKLFHKLPMRGTTPTGPAILKAVRYYMQERIDGSSNRNQDKDVSHRNIC